MQDIKKMLETKSTVSISKDGWHIQTENSDYNQAGSMGRNDLISRQDAVYLLGAMHLKLKKALDECEKDNPMLAKQLLESMSVMSYAMWGIRELEPVEKVSDSGESKEQLSLKSK